MVLFPVILIVQNWFIYDMLAALKQINKSARFNNLLWQKVMFFNVDNLFNFFVYICMLNLGGLQLFLHIVFSLEFWSLTKWVDLAFNLVVSS